MLGFEPAYTPREAFADFAARCRRPVAAPSGSLAALADQLPARRDPPAWEGRHG